MDLQTEIHIQQMQMFNELRLIFIVKYSRQIYRISTSTHPSAGLPFCLKTCNGLSITTKL